MPYAQIEAEFTAEQRTAVLAALATIEASFDVLVNLTPLERRTIPKMGSRTYEFVSRAVEITEQNPQFVAPYVNAAGMTQDFHYAVAIRAIVSQMGSLMEKLSGTGLAAGSEAYLEALAFYSSLKTAAKSQVPGASALHADLASRFPRNVSAEDPGEEPEEDPES